LMACLNHAISSFPLFFEHVGNVHKEASKDTLPIRLAGALSELL
jgi:hypothetical protein